MASVPGLLSGDEPLPEDMMAALQAMEEQGGVPGLLAPTSEAETPEQAAAAIRNRLQMIEHNRMMAPESGYAGRSEPILGGPNYGVVGGPARQALSPTEKQYWEDYSRGLYETERGSSPSEDPGVLARIAAEAQRVAPMPPASGPGGATYPLYQSPYDLYQAIQMSPQNFNTWATRRAQTAVGNPSR